MFEPIGRGIAGAVAVAAVAGMGILAAPVALADTPGSTTATSQVANINIPGVDVHQSTPTTVTNDGSGPTTPTVANTTIANSALVIATSVGNYQLAQAGTDGSSLACAGVNVNTNGLSVGADGKSCTNTVSPFTPRYALHSISLIQGALSTVGCNGFSFLYKTITSSAYSDGAGTPSGSAAVTTVNVSPCAGGGGTPGPCTGVSVPSDPAVDYDLWAAIIAATRAKGTVGCDQAADVLQSIASQVSMVTNHQVTNPDGSFSVTGLHFATLSGSPASFDLATSTVGPNTAPVVDTPIVSAEALSLIAAGLLIAVLASLAIRRRRPAALDH
jgi:hypothetical protein